MLYFIPPAPQRAEQLAELSARFAGSGSGQRVGGRFPPRPCRDVAGLVRAGDTAGLSLVEWHGFLSDRAFWLQLGSGTEVEALVLNIFAEVERNQALRNMVLTKAAMSIETEVGQLPVVLMDRFEWLNESLSRRDKLCFKLIHAFRMRHQGALIDALLKNRLSPVGLLNWIGWPRFTRMRDALEDMLLAGLDGLDLATQQELLLRCLDDFQGARLVALVDKVLATLEPGNMSQELRQWLDRHARPESPGDLWSRINERSRSILSALLKLSNFPVFLRLIQRLADVDPDCFADDAGDPQVRRVLARSRFWSNYSQRMISCRLLLQPRAFSQAIRQMGAVGAESLVRAGGDVEEASEWLLMEFADIVVAEQLSRSWGAARVFRKTVAVESGLLARKTLTTSDLLMAYQDDIHDHYKLWQWSLERKLRERYRLLPNEGTQFFNGLPPEYGRYDRASGLPTPDKASRQQRVVEVRAWEDRLISSELARGKYGNARTGMAGIHAVRADRIREMLRPGRGTNGEALAELRQHAERDECWALELLAHHLLTVPGGSPQERREGEYYLHRARALQGHAAG